MEFWNFNVSGRMKGFAGISNILERDRKDHLFPLSRMDYSTLPGYRSDFKSSTLFIRYIKLHTANSTGEHLP
jgi:hypothetical protein